MRAEADVASKAGKPAHALVAQLQDERRLTAAWQAGATKSSRSALDNARSSTDSAVADFRRTRAGLTSGSTAVRSKAESLNDALGKLAEQRSTINARKISAPRAIRFYTDTTAQATGLLTAATRSQDGGLARGADATTSLVKFSEILSSEDALLTSARPGARSVREGPTASSARGEFSQYLAVQRQSRKALNTGDLPQGGAGAYKQLTATPQWKALVKAEETAASRTDALSRETDTWQESAGVVGKELRQLSSDSLNGVVKGGSDRANALLLGAALGTVLALAVLAFSIVLAVRSARSLTGRLSQLQRATEEWADTTFPQLVEQLGLDEKSEPVFQTPGGEYGSDEVGGLAAEIQRQWRTVVETTVQQARGREGAETVFLGLARRTQVLINRMIPKLDKLEREHEDSKLLKDIFAVDHLATRVRRHTENLLILGGALPGRRWSKAVPIYEVLRSAISETEDYSRVEALPAPPVSLIGQAVADVGHLLAELIENGTSFSPPDTRVCVSAEKVAKGLALEVVDRGLGMPSEQYDELNQLLADPPKPDMMTLGEAPRLGLFVVARLANRHGLEVSLRKSAYGGTLAVVLLPSDLLEENHSLLSGLVPESRRESRPEREEREEREAPEEFAATGVSSYPSAPPLPAGTPVGAGLESGVEYAVEYAAAGNGAVSAFGGTDSAADVDNAVPQPHLDEHRGYPAYAGAGLLPSTPGADSPEILGTSGLIPGTLSVPGPGMLDTSGTGVNLSLMGMSTSGSGSSPHGAGLLEPSAPDTDTPVEDAPMSASRPRPPHDHAGHVDHVDHVDHFDHVGDAGYTAPAEPEVPQVSTPDGPDRLPDRSLTPGRLPVRVRGENLAEQLRHTSHEHSEPDDPSAGASSSPDRAGATMAAIQSGSKRARASKPAEPVGDPEAETPGHGAGTDDSVWKDQ